MRRRPARRRREHAAGVSGAVLLLPVQVSVLDVPSPAVTPANLLHNVLATPGALVRYGRRGGAFVRPLLAGTLPLGAVVRVERLAGERALLAVAAGVLAPLGLSPLLRPTRRHPRPLTPPALARLAFVAGAVGGVDGVGGGSILAPILLGCGYGALRVAPASRRRGPRRRDPLRDRGGRMSERCCSAGRDRRRLYDPRPPFTT